MSDAGGRMAYSMSGSREQNEPFIVAVFDGMGGEQCGELASLIAAKYAADFAIGQQPVEDLNRFCREANDEICRYADDNNIRSMGTTAAILAFAKKEIALCNIGDSKVFRFDGEKLDQISTDDYAVAFPGRKPPLSQNLGIPMSEMVIEPHLARGFYHDGDVYLLCSDGLTDMVDADVIREILSDPDVNKAVDRLLYTALYNGGTDNITIIVCRVEKRQRHFLSRIFHDVFG